jgi:kinesin family protein 13
VNGKLIHGETLLHHGDRVALGMNHFFRLNCPADDLANEITKKSFDDYNKAQEEILLQNRHISSNIITSANEENSNNNNLEEIENETEEKSVSSSTTFSNSNSIDENGLTIEMAIQKFEHDYANFKSDRITNLDHSMLSNSSSTSSLGMTNRNSSSKSFQNQTNDSNRQKSYSILNDLKFRKGLQTLREKLLRANSLAREANSLCKELNRPLKFRTTLQIPPTNLTPNRKKDSLLSEPAIIIKVKENKSSNDFKRNSDNDKIIIDFETFENYIFELREAYSDKFKQSNDEKNDEDLESEQIIPKIFTKSQSYYFNLIGVANIFLDVLSYEAAIPFEYYVGIINQQGELAGRLKIKLEVLSPIKLNENSSSQDEEENQQDLNSKKLVKYRFNIIEAIELPINLNNLVFCQYKFWSQSEPTIVRSVKESSNKNSKSLNNYSSYSTVKFDHEKEFEIEVNEDFNEYCLDSALSIEIYSHRHINPTNGILADKTQLEKIEKLNKMAKFQSLVDSWSELSKSYELNVKILELDNEGSWSPVEVKPHQLNLTGGIYQLKQGQSRQISVNINQVKPKSVMHYNGTLFYLEPHKIDKISVGCVYGTNIGLQAPLDSYQEVDLNKLRNKCRTILENRKSYLHVQIKSLYESDKLEDQERRDLLSKQLIDLGEEIVEIDAPRENSGLPGSTIEWTPSEGMEEHVPIIYLDLNESQIAQNLDANDSEDDERENHRKNKISTYGDDCYLKNEPQNARFIDLKLIRWNDSSLVEVVDNELNDYNNDFDYSSGGDETEEYTNNSQSSTSNLSLKATARWDSSVHQSLYLNQPTPLDRHVYLTIKINLKFKKLDTNNKFINEYVNVVLRKRVCVCVYVPSASTKLINLNRFKTLLGSSPNLNKIKTKIINNIGPLSSFSSCYSTGITYRIIANIPRLLSEIENRESLAIQAAASINEDINNLSDDNKKSNNKNSINILEDSLSYFEHYAKTIEAVEKILKQDRIYQRLHIEKIINFVQKNGHLPSDIDELDLNKKDNDDSLSKSSFFQKTLSVPNLIKNGLGSVKNMSVMSPKPVNKTNKVFNKSSKHFLFYFIFSLKYINLIYIKLIFNLFLIKLKKLKRMKKYIMIQKSMSLVILSKIKNYLQLHNKFSICITQ